MPHQAHATMNNKKIMNVNELGRRETKHPIPEQAGGPKKAQIARMISIMGNKHPDNTIIVKIQCKHGVLGEQSRPGTSKSKYV